MSKSGVLPVDWDLLLSSAARLQRILPEAVLVGGTAAALYAEHRVSSDADHVLVDLRDRFDEVLHELEAVTGWKEAKVTRPVQVLGSLDGIETGVRQLIRVKPLETAILKYKGLELTVPTEAEILRIKAFLILKRNATKDYVDFMALADHLGVEPSATALGSLDSLYPQKSGESALQQLLAQLSNALPYDLKNIDLSNYKNLDKRWNNFDKVRKAMSDIAVDIFDLRRESENHNHPTTLKP
ncbi:MAG: hypothetical protein LBF22_12795 [Deltaproteobacteria bacterium]|jgi:hypothetical protein|nr:hypothetical protein [Deltaproteobacteria bacterium]